MEAGDRADDFIPSALAAFGIEADEAELAVIAAVDQLFWPPILALLELDLGEVEPEPFPDLARPPAGG